MLNLVNVTILYRKRQIWNKLVTFFKVKGWWGFAFAYFNVTYLSTTWHWLTSSFVYEMYRCSPTGLKITFVLVKLVKQFNAWYAIYPNKASGRGNILYITKHTWNAISFPVFIAFFPAEFSFYTFNGIISWLNLREAFCQPREFTRRRTLKKIF